MGGYIQNTDESKIELDNPLLRVTQVCKDHTLRFQLVNNIQGLAVDQISQWRRKRTLTGFIRGIMKAD